MVNNDLEKKDLTKKDLVKKDSRVDDLDKKDDLVKKGKKTYDLKDEDEKKDESIYDRFESYHFEVKTWEEIDPETFGAPNKATNKLTLFEQFVDAKMKFFAYLNFFSNDQYLVQLLFHYEPIYRDLMEDLIADTDIAERFKAQEKLDSENLLFKQHLSANKDLETIYLFFEKNVHKFTSFSNEFGIKVNDNFLVETGLKQGKLKSVKVIEIWDRTKKTNNIIRAFPMFTKDAGNYVLKFVCFLNNAVRNSIDFYENASEIKRVYLPRYIHKVEESFEKALEQSKLVSSDQPIFCNDSDAMKNYLDTDQVSIYFDPNRTEFDGKIELVPLAFNKNSREISIF